MLARTTDLIPTSRLPVCAREESCSQIAAPSRRLPSKAPKHGRHRGSDRRSRPRAADREISPSGNWPEKACHQRRLKFYRLRKENCGVLASHVIPAKGRRSLLSGGGHRGIAQYRPGVKGHSAVRQQARITASAPLWPIDRPAWASEAGSRRARDADRVVVCSQNVGPRILLATRDTAALGAGIRIAGAVFAPPRCQPAGSGTLGGASDEQETAL